MDKLNEFFDNLEKNIDNGFKEQKGGGKFFVGRSSDSCNKTAGDVLNDIIGKKTDRAKQEKKGFSFKQCLNPGDFPGMVLEGNSVKGPQYSDEKVSLFGMTFDYKDGERHRITQEKINRDSDSDGWAEGLFLSKGPNFESSFWSQTGPKFQQFYSYVMRNSSRTVNKIFNFIFKKIGNLMEGDEYNNLKMKIFIATHVFALLSFFINIGTILTISFIIVLVWILKYALMSKYSGLGALTMVFDFLGVGTFLLSKTFLCGIFGIGIIWFMIPNLPFIATLLTVPIVITVKMWFFYLFGYIFSNNYKYGMMWISNNIKLNWAFLVFEILLLNAIAIKKYWPHDNNSFLKYLMIEGFGMAIPAGAMLGLVYSEWKANGSFITPIVFIVLCSVLTTTISKFN